MLNKTIQMGRFTRDPELRSTPQGESVVSFSLAVDRDYTEKDGTRKTDFPNFVAWKGTAEFISKYFRKGSMAIVEGRLQTRTWDDSDGKKRQATEVVVNNIYFGESKKDNAPADSDVGYSDGLYIDPMGTDSDLPF